MSNLIAEMLKKMIDLEQEQARTKVEVQILAGDIESLKELLKRNEHRTESIQRVVQHYEGVEYGG